jgi:aerobic-type carbon monoxide dehydrogenase small subunit (CoxS/CutS family)
MSKPKHNKKLSRRGFIGGTSAALVAATTPLIPAQTATGGTSDVPRSKIRLTINGKAQSIEVEDRWTLAEALRDHLNLTGTKIGCDRGECGACTVLLEGKPVYSCSHLAAWMDGKSIQTVEGLETNGRLDPLQKSFMEHDAPQCGYCTSGQLMSAKACLNQHPHATAEEVRAAMTGNICRCSNYNRYVEATLAAGGTSDIGKNMAKIVLVDAAGEKPLKGLNTVGHPTTRIDARQRVTGKATYTRDVILPGMLYASVLRSPHPHARIRSIDASKALAMPGVKTVVTHENCQFVWGAGSIAGGRQYADDMKKITKQRRYAFNNPVRYAGEPVAAVAAIDRHNPMP